MQRLTKLDAIDMLPRVPPVLVSIATGLAFTGVAWGTRAFIDLFAPAAGPFVVNIPAILLATLVGHMTAGLVTLIAATMVTWYYVLLPSSTFVFADPADGPRMVVNIVVALIVILITDMARRAVRGMVREREERIRERDMLLREIDHRVKNNLSILASLLSVQKRKATNPEVQEALEEARGRVYSLAKAYDFLNLRGGGDEDIEMRSFLGNLVEAVHGSAQTDERIRMEVTADEWRLDREHAGAAGLLVNELITNSIKHAFKGRDGGTIRVTLTAHGDVAELKVQDDGVGFDTSSESAGKGTAFLQALARTARADLVCMSGKNGTCYTARLTNSGRAA